MGVKDLPKSSKNPGRKAYLDIETDYVGYHTDQRLFTDYENHKITVIGIRIIGKGEDTFIQLVDRKVTRTNLINALDGVDCLITYNGRSVPDRVKGYTGFDFPVIAAQLGIVLDRKFLHIDLAPLCWEHGLYGGQKKIEVKLGLKRESPDRDGAWACEAWRKYKKSKNKRYLDQLLRYNHEDVFMLERIERSLRRA